MKENDLVSVYVGSAIRARYLDAVLSQNNIPSLLRNNLQEATHGGFGGPGTEDACEIFVEQQDYETAEKIIFDFIKNNEDTNQ